MAKLCSILNPLPLCESITLPDKFPMSGFAEFVHFAILGGCEKNAFSFFPLLPDPHPSFSIFLNFLLFFLLESRDMELQLVHGSIKPILLWAEISEESHSESSSEGEAAMLHELGKQKTFLQTMQRGTELVCREGNLTL